LKHEILIIGRGGQGILLLGRVLGLAAAKYSDLYVASTESYGAETRGSESRAELIVADNRDEIDYIKVRKATILLIMYPFNIEKYVNNISDNAKVFLNKTHVTSFAAKPGWVIYGAPYPEIAERETGTSRTANMVALGHVVAKTGLVKPQAIEDALRELVRGEWVELNIKAFQAGYKLE